MNDQAIARLETKLEQLIEGAFAQLFSKTIRAQDIALHLCRAMDDGLLPAADGDLRPFAPDHYTIRLNADVCDHLLVRQPTLPQILSQHLIELAASTGYRLSEVPVIELNAVPTMEPTDIAVHASHQHATAPSTAVMERIEIPDVPAPKNPQLILNGSVAIPLTEPLINIGRSRANHIVLDDPYASRHHAQLRLRFGVYTIFDPQSQGHVLVNDVVVREHRLQPGDVIRLGRTQLVYIEDTSHLDGQTDSGEPVDL